MKKAALFIALLIMASIPFTVTAMDPCGSTTGKTAYDICQLQFSITKLQAQLTQLVMKADAERGGATCLDLKNNLVPGSTDALNNNEVSKLQCFLKGTGFFPDAQCTGYYGSKTAEAVVRWQKAHGMDFVTIKSGVGPMTRSKMSCSQAAAQCPSYESKPVVNSINPRSGSNVSTVELQGCNFLGFEGDKTVWVTDSTGEKAPLNGAADEATRTSNTVLRFKLGTRICKDMNWYSGLPCTSYMLIRPGTYSIYTNSYGGNSNPVDFTVTNMAN